jgi:hypothetical protein
MSFDQMSIGNECKSGWPTWNGPRLPAQTGRSYEGIAAAREEILREVLSILAAAAPNDRCCAGSEVATNVPAPTRLSKYPSARSCA